MFSSLSVFGLFVAKFRAFALKSKLGFSKALRKSPSLIIPASSPLALRIIAEPSLPVLIAEIASFRLAFSFTIGRFSFRMTS